MSAYAVKLDDNLHIIEIAKKRSSGLAHQQAVRFTDDGFRARVVDTEDDAEIDYLYSQLVEKRDKGYIEEYGYVPNGTRVDGDGSRTLGRMIFPAFGGKLEVPEGDSAQESQSEALKTPVPLTFSSSEFSAGRKNEGGFRLNIG